MHPIHLAQSTATPPITAHLIPPRRGTAQAGGHHGCAKGIRSYNRASFARLVGTAQSTQFRTVLPVNQESPVLPRAYVALCGVDDGGHVCWYGIDRTPCWRLSSRCVPGWAAARGRVSVPSSDEHTCIQEAPRAGFPISAFWRYTVTSVWIAGSEPAHAIPPCRHLPGVLCFEAETLQYSCRPVPL